MDFSLEQSTYLLLMIGSALFPVIFSFEKQIHFVSRWKYLPIAIGVPAALFIAWDVWFTQTGIWWFSNEYTLGIRILDLPVEEWLFFIVVPFCSIFIYENVKFFLHKFSYHDRLVQLLWFVVVLFFLIAIVANNLSYTFWNFTFNTLFLIFLLFVGWFRKHITHFLITFLIGTFPMMLVNGILTSFPVVSYNPSEFSNLRLFSIPVEDFVYYFLLVGMNVFFYEVQQRKHHFEN
jgi:lycopene cyclase domain-containing protein